MNLLPDPFTGSTADDAASSLTIREVTGEKRTLFLQGRALPYRPFELGVSQRVTTTWLPGYAEGTATVLGSKDDQTTCNGFWKDRFLQPPVPPRGGSSALSGVRDGLVQATSTLTGGFDVSSTTPPAASLDGEPVQSVRDLVAIVEDFTRQGQLLAVVWDRQARKGHILRFLPRWHNIHDVEWELTFEWIGRLDVPSPCVLPQQATTSSLAAKAGALLADLEDILLEAPALASAFDDLIQSKFQAVQSAVEQVQAAAEAVESIGEQPSLATRRTQALVSSLSDAAQAFADAAVSTPFTAMLRESEPQDRFGSTQTYQQAQQSGAVVGSGGALLVDAAARISSAAFACSARAIARELMASAEEKEAEVRSSSTDGVLGSYTAREGEDLRDAAFAFYGEASAWRRIMVFNGLRSSALEVGQVVQVPRLDGGAA